MRAVRCADHFYDWNIELYPSSAFSSQEQPVITINGMFPGPLINMSTNDVAYVNVFNNLDEPLLFTWNGLQQRLNSWEDGVSGTNCPIRPGTNWTYVFQAKDQIGTFFYFPSLNFHKAAGGFGPIRVNNRKVIAIPFPTPEAEYDLLIGDWYNQSYKTIRSSLSDKKNAYGGNPDALLMNGKLPYGFAENPETFNVTKGKTYRIRVSNVGNALSFNFRIQGHKMAVVEAEGSYTAQITVDSLDIHVGQSYSVLVTADRAEADHFIVATPKLVHAEECGQLTALGVLHYENSTAPPSYPIPSGPNAFDIDFSIHQAKSIRWNMTAGAARPNPQGTFNVSHVTPNQTFVLHGSTAEIDGAPRYTVNNVSYHTRRPPLKLADFLVNGSGVYQLDSYPVESVNPAAESGVFVTTGLHKGWIELVFVNGLHVMDSWHLDGFGFYVVGFGDGDWMPSSRSTYNRHDPVVRSTVQVYPGKWTAVYAYLDNPGMWNLRSQHSKHWYLGQELYVRVYDADPNPAKERPPPENLLLCG
ncbi:monocopper oxidase-like protein SKU5 [Rhodamnia argentea]|uniref:Monocopper oxidase-like protein SKU5 n=1 Tax=Rhodamnia argentea TaxID=178133 RepID=A0A8B8QVW6_9MYRT|nr:monocopper oxidase-like protein SKU5 [Rhodamnia argentea]